MAQKVRKKIGSYRSVRARKHYELSDGWKSLAGAIVIQAITDLNADDALTRLDAWAYLGGDAPLILEMLDLQDVDILNCVG